MDALKKLFSLLWDYFESRIHPAPAPALDDPHNGIKAPPDAPHALAPVVLVEQVDDRPVVHPNGWCEGAMADRKAMETLALKICKQEGLPVYGKAPWGLGDDLLATIWGESGWNQWCVNTRTHDYGLCQFSAVYYLKEYKMTAQQALDNPEKCLTIMARNFKAGRQSNWVAYASRTHNLGRRLLAFGGVGAPVPSRAWTDL